MSGKNRRENYGWKWFMFVKSFFPLEHKKGEFSFLIKVDSVGCC